jgi:hypothetical protein
MPTDLFMQGFADFQRTKIEMDCVRQCVSTGWNIGKRCVKGQCHEINILFESFNILIGNFCVCADGLQRLSKAFQFPMQLLYFYLLL